MLPVSAEEDAYADPPVLIWKLQQPYQDKQLGTFLKGVPYFFSKFFTVYFYIQKYAIMNDELTNNVKLT
jgi:hypothetical protein